MLINQWDELKSMARRKKCSFHNCLNSPKENNRMTALAIHDIPVLRRRRSQRGFNLIEAAIVLGVIGLVIGGIWVAAASVQRNNRRAEIQGMAVRLYEGFRVAWPRAFPFTPNCGPILCFTETLISPTVGADTAPTRYHSDLEQPTQAKMYVSPTGIYFQVTGFPDAVTGNGDMITFKVGPLDYGDCVWLAGNIDTGSGWTGGRFYRWLNYTYTGYEWPSHQRNGTISGITPSNATTVCQANDNFVNFNIMRP
jgi:hypothetical protein